MSLGTVLVVYEVSETAFQFLPVLTTLTSALRCTQHSTAQQVSSRAAPFSVTQLRMFAPPLFEMSEQRRSQREKKKPEKLRSSSSSSSSGDAVTLVTPAMTPAQRRARAELSLLDDEDDAEESERMDEARGERMRGAMTQPTLQQLAAVFQQILAGKGDIALFQTPSSTSSSSSSSASSGAASALDWREMSSSSSSSSSPASQRLRPALLDDVEDELEAKVQEAKVQETKAKPAKERKKAAPAQKRKGKECATSLEAMTFLIEQRWAPQCRERWNEKNPARLARHWDVLIQEMKTRFSQDRSKEQLYNLFSNLHKRSAATRRRRPSAVCLSAD